MTRLSEIRSEELECRGKNAKWSLQFCKEDQLLIDVVFVSYPPGTFLRWAKGVFIYLERRRLQS